MQVKNADPFNQLNTSSATGEIRSMMDKWYNSLMGGTEADYTARTTELQNGIRRQTRGKVTTGEDRASKVMYSAKSINGKISFIGNLKRKIMQISNNSSMTYSSKKKAIDKLNNIVKELEG